MQDTYVKSHWSELKGKIKGRWNRLTDEDLNAADGRIEQVCAKIRERYGVTDADARRQFEQFTQSLEETGDTKAGSSMGSSGERSMGSSMGSSAGSSAENRGQSRSQSQGQTPGQGQKTPSPGQSPGQRDKGAESEN